MGAGAERLPAPRRPHPEPRRDGQGLRGPGADRARGGDQGARQRGRHQGDARAGQRSRGASRSSRTAQSELGGALARLLVTVERYPELKSNQNFLALQSQLEGTENRIAVERMRFNEAVRDYNTRLRLFPGSLVASLPRLQGEGLLRGGAGQRGRAQGEVLAGAPGGSEPVLRRADARRAAPGRSLAAPARGGPARPAAARPPGQRLRGRAVPRRARSARGAARRARARRAGNQVVVADLPLARGREPRGLLDPARPGLADRPEGPRQRRHLPRLPRRPEDAHRGRLRARGQPDRRGLVVHSPRRGRPALPRGQDRRRHRGGPRRHRPRDRRHLRAPARGGPGRPPGRGWAREQLGAAVRGRSCCIAIFVQSHMQRAARAPARVDGRLDGLGRALHRRRRVRRRGRGGGGGGGGFSGGGGGFGGGGSSGSW